VNAKYNAALRCFVLLFRFCQGRIDLRQTRDEAQDERVLHVSAAAAAAAAAAAWDRRST